MADQNRGINTTAKGNPEQGFLPDFCRPPAVITVAVFMELFAVVVALSSAPGWSEFWFALALLTLFTQWIGLLSSAVLCFLRRYFSPVSTTRDVALVFVMMMVAVGAFSEITFRFHSWIELPLIRVEHGYFLARNLIIGAVIAGILLRYLYLNHQWREQIVAENEARFAALQARIRPHFLFNSINTVVSLIHTNPKMAEHVALDLADLFRAAIETEDALIPLEQELKITRQYLDLEKTRLGDRLQIDWKIEGNPATVLIPPLTLQPLVENGVYHGIERMDEGGLLSIWGNSVAKGYQLRIRNTNSDSSAESRTGLHVGLENIRQRLEARFGSRAEFRYTRGPKTFEVMIQLPDGDLPPAA